MRQFVHDTWAPLAYIPELGDTSTPPTAPTWVDPVDARRLTAYRVLAAYLDNVRRYWLPDSRWETRAQNVDGYMRIEKGEASSYREYGDPGLVVDTARALILGEDQSVEIDDPRPVPDGGELPPDERHEWVRTWVVKERLTQKLLQGEANSVALGDGVYTLGFDTRTQRPRLRVYDPGFYFPDPHAAVEGWGDDEFPPVVHLAWEYDDDQGVTWVRRHTWRMTRLDHPVQAPWGGVREYTCLYRVVDYRLDRLIKNATVYSEELSTTTVVVQDWTDLLVDFIPVVHVPNTPGEWGASILLRVGQILDDLANTDTDTALIGQTSAAPTLATDSPAPLIDGRPGSTIQGAAGWVDTSKNLIAVKSLADSLLERLAVNTRLAQALLGRVQPNEVPSGYALSLGFHPARQLMREARTIRDEKYPLLLKFALRLAQANNVVPAGETPNMRISLGASLPADLQVAVETVKNLLPVHGISLDTAVRILAQAGLPIEDAEAEVAAIRRDMTEQAKELVEATGDVDAARERLGLGPSLTQLIVGEREG
jgi:hypothetical protein